MTDDTADLAARVDSLEDAVDDLRATREGDRDSRRTTPRGPFSVPRPPTPRELLRFAVDDAIPATVALLDAQVRALEALRAALRLLESGRPSHDAVDGTVGREALDRLDTALAELRAAVSGDALPENAAARDLLEDARALTADLEAEVEAARADRRSRETRDGAVENETAPAERERRTERVEDELEQLRDEYDDENGDTDGA